MLTGKAVPCFPQSISSDSKPGPSLNFPSPARSWEEETSLMWVLSLQMLPENVTFHFGA